MKVYHGTNARFEKVDLNKCNLHNDFGRGFYITSVKLHAEQRAQNIAERFGGEPVVMEFDFDEKCLNNSLYRTLVFEKPTRKWVEFIMQNRDRKNTTPVHHFDIVAGPVADDKMRRQFDRYEAKEITMEKLLSKVTYSEPTHQIMLATETVLELIYLKPTANPLSDIEDIISAVSIALVRNNGLDMIEAMKIVYNSQTFAQLTEESNELYKKSWQEIYEMLTLEMK
ncbi:hypothetical protein FACS189434_01440 [Bacteroidia bacterium]|nr:hypothetical protein FACS189434_01440 [Bacteroidia bacterium]